MDCVGREDELGRLRALLDLAVSRRSGQVAFVSGAAGLGKTRLLVELGTRLRAAGVPVFDGRCRDGALYQPIVEILEQALASLEGAGPILQDGAQALAALRGQGPARVRDGVDRRMALFERVREVLAFVAGAGRARPVAFLVHDLHLADEATALLVQYLLRALAPALAPVSDFTGLFVVSSEAPPGVSGATPLIDDLAAETITLGPLDEAGVRAFLSTPQAVARFLAASGGNPRRLEELLDAGAPAALSPGAATLLGAIALLGRPAGAALVGRLADALAIPASAAQELVGSPQLVRSVSGGELRLGFALAGERDAACRVIPAGARPTLHAALAEALTDPEDLPLAAEHALAASVGGESESAVELALQAGERLEGAFNYERAIALYGQARAATRRPEIQSLLDERLVELGELKGDYALALAAAERLAAERPDDPRSLGRIGHLHLLAGDFERAREVLTAAREVGAHDADRAVHVHILADSAEAYLLGGAHDEALTWGRAALALARPGDRGRQAARNTLGKVFLEKGDYASAALLFGENLAEATSPSERARALINLGISEIRRGDPTAAEARYRDGLSAARDAGDARHLAFCHQNLGVLADGRRDYAQALRHYQDAVGAFKRLGHKPWLAWVAIDLGDLYLSLGDSDRAQAMADLAGKLLSSPTTAVIHANLVARVALERGDTTRARLGLEGALATARRIGNRDELALTLIRLARVALADRDAAGALRPLAEVDPSKIDAKIAAQLRLVRSEAHLAAGLVERAREDAIAADRAYLELGDDEGRVDALVASAAASEAAGEARLARRARDLARALDADLRGRVPDEFLESYGRRRSFLRVAVVAAAAEITPIKPVLRSRHPKIVGDGPSMRRVLDVIDRVAPTASLVLVRGESGTGKELVAEAIHEASPRRQQPFIKVNCGALVESLLLSELFGHERGAFTGALARKKGRFEMADGGTIFLDEIGDISPQTQVALLRVLQQREFERVGGTAPVHVDVRIVCATHRDLEAMVAAGQFREDLYYRLKGIEIELPPLRAREGDLVAIAESILARVGAERDTAPKRLAPSGAEALLRHPWPGNIRELENVLRSVTLFADGDEIDARALADYLGPDTRKLQPAAPRVVASSAPASGSGDATDLGDVYDRALASKIPLRELKRRIELECITRALADENGNITRAAERLGMKRPRLSQLLKEHRIEIGTKRERL